MTAIDRQVAAMVKDTRLRAGIYRRNLARTFGVHEATLEKLENGRSVWTVSELADLADLLDHNMTIELTPKNRAHTDDREDQTMRPDPGGYEEQQPGECEGA